MRFLSLVLLSFFLIWSIQGNAQAPELSLPLSSPEITQPITIETDDDFDLESSIRQGVEFLKHQTLMPVKFKFDGDVVVEKTESHDAITLPYLIIEDGKIIYDVGFISINAIENGHNGAAIALALPSPITAKDVNGLVLNTFSIDRQLTEISFKTAQTFHSQLSLMLDGLTIQNSLGDIEQLAPTSIRLNIDLSNFPADELLTLYANSLSAVQAMPELAPLTWLSLAIKIPNILATSKAALTINNTVISGEGYNAATTMTIIGNTDAKNLATGDAKLSFNGLNPLIEKIRIRMEAAGTSQQKAQYEDLLNTLGAIKVSSKVSEDPDGMITHTAHMVMNEDGTITLNQQPYSMLKNLINIPALLKIVAPLMQNKTPNPSSSE